MSWQELRQILLTELSEVIGSYQLQVASGKVSVAAIHCSPPQVPNNRKVTGLEVIISKAPDFERDLMLNSTEIRTRWYAIFFIQHGIKGSTTEEAIAKILTRFNDAVFAGYFTQTDTTPEQTIIKIPYITKEKLYKEYPQF